IVLDGDRHAEQRPPVGTGGPDSPRPGGGFGFVAPAGGDGPVAVGLFGRGAARDRFGPAPAPRPGGRHAFCCRFGQGLLRYNASPRKSFGTSPTSPAASRMNRFFSPGSRSTRPSPTSRTIRNTSERLENSRLRPSVATPMAMVSKRRQRW